MTEATAREQRSDLTSRLQRAFHDRLPIPPHAEEQLAAALRETLQRPGSLFRAELALQGAVVYGLAEEHGEQLAIALEYFHTASLIFDDLPSMDDAALRRGKACIHQIYGEGTAILSALALINRAYALLWASMQELPLSRRQLSAAFIEEYLGLNGILDGQSRDIHFARPGAPEQRAQQIAMEKTVSLIRLPLVLPAIMGGASAQERDLLNRLAKMWGLGYQALDDLKDVLRAQQQTGKTTGRDELLQRPNVALELGTERTIARLQRLARLSKRLIRRLIAQRPALSFLEEVGARFDAETRMTLQDTEGAACFS